MTSPSEHTRAIGTAAAVALIILLVGVAFLQASRFDFLAYDDNRIVYDNPVVTTGLSWENVKWAFTHAHFYIWMPLTTLSHMADVTFFGLWAGGHHLTSVLLHAVNAALLFLALRTLTGRPGLSLIVAILFAIHPLCINCTVWIASRKDLVSGFFFLLLLLIYPLYTRKPGALRYISVCLVFLLGLMSKPNMVTAPCLLLLLDWWPLERLGTTPLFSSAGVRRTAILAVEKLPMVLLAAGTAYIATQTQDLSAFQAKVIDHGFTTKLGDVALRYVHYLGLFLFPTGAAIHYPELGFVRTPATFLLAGALLLMTSMGVLLAWRKRYLVVGWFWYLGMMVPVIGFVRHSHAYMAGRYMYIPQIGLAIMLVWLAADLLAPWMHRRHAQRALIAAAALALIALTAWTATQARYWRNTESVFAHALTLTQNNDVAYKFLGNIEEERGNLEGAIPYYEAAIKASPNNYDGYRCLGTTLLKLGRYEDARIPVISAAKIYPNDFRNQANLGIIRVATGDFAGAVRALGAAMNMNPDNREVCANLAIAQMRLGNVESAGILLNTLLASSEIPGTYLAEFGLHLYQLGRPGDAAILLSRAVVAQPDNPAWLFNLGSIQLELGNRQEALRLLKRAVAIRPDEYRYQANLGLILTATDPTQAIAHFETAAGLAPNDTQVQLGLAQALIAAGDQRRARGVLERVLVSEPQNSLAKGLLMELSPGN